FSVALTSGILSRHTVAIVGAGFGGIGMAIRLKSAGWNDFIILEQADTVGGTWRDNTYPGCACDIPSHLYSLSFAPNVEWSRRYPSQGEILSYLEQCIDRFDLRPHLRMGTGLLEAQISHVLRCLRVLTKRRVASVEVRLEAQATSMRRLD